MRASFEAVRAATGIDLSAIIRGRAVAEVFAEATPGRRADGDAPVRPSPTPREQPGDGS